MLDTRRFGEIQPLTVFGMWWLWQAGDPDIKRVFLSSLSRKNTFSMPSTGRLGGICCFLCLHVFISRGLVSLV